MAMALAGTNLDLAARAQKRQLNRPGSGFYVDLHQNLGYSDRNQTQRSEFNSWSCQDKLRRHPFDHETLAVAETWF